MKYQNMPALSQKLKSPEKRCSEDIGVQNISLHGFVLEHQWTVNASWFRRKVSAQA